jgi:general secretion pathway protein F
MKGGMPLAQALMAMGESAQNASYKMLILEIRQKILEGISLSRAMQGLNGAFNDSYLAMIRAGEHSGHLEGVLESLSNALETRLAAKRQLIGTLIYPIVLLAVSIAVITTLMVYIIPDIAKVFVQSGAELPPLTRFVMSCSELIAGYGWFIAMGILVACAMAAQTYRRPRVRYAVHACLAQAPLAKKLVRALSAESFVSSLSLLCSSGIPLDQALHMSGLACTNLWIRTHYLQIAQRVKEGQNLNAAMARSRLFPPMMLHLIASGERSGNINDMMERSARYQRDELDMWLSTLSKLIEPLMIVMMALIVGVIVLSIMLPIVQMNTLV